VKRLEASKERTAGQFVITFLAVAMPSNDARNSLKASSSGSIDVSSDRE